MPHNLHIKYLKLGSTVSLRLNWKNGLPISVLFIYRFNRCPIWSHGLSKVTRRQS